MINELKKAYTQYALKIFFTLLASTVIYSCSKSDDEPEEVNEQEVINRVSIVLSEGSNSQTVTWNEGSTPPAITLDVDKVYTASIYFYDASDPTDVEDITLEIIEEVDEHYCLWEIAGLSNLTITSASTDYAGSDGIPINLVTDWSTGGAESGNIKVTLIHEPTTKSGTNRASFGGETDIELTFPTTVQ
ncbi:MAG: hypothetical protein CMC48_05470 [Flavobacteriaceae bacterium]|nr:hypothetical protein [Flavobacteriaceae bacterium]|tara:strand:+ start:386 stop:952 length:567 start_codon:yes stop_codon:yes gene_type:complete